MVLLEAKNKLFSESELAQLVLGFLTICFLCLANIWLGFNLWILIVCLALLAVFIYRQPEHGLFLAILGTIFFERYFTLTPMIIGESTIKFYPLDFVLLFTALAFIIRLPEVVFASGDIKKLLTTVIFILVVIAGLVRGYLLHSDTGLATAILKNYSYAVVVLLTIWQVRDVKKLWQWLALFSLSGIGLLFFVAWGYVAGHGLWSEYTPGLRYLAGTHAFYLLLAFLTTLILFVFDHQLFNRRLTIAIMALQALGIVGSMFRHIWVGLALSLVVLVLLFPTTQKVKLLRLSAGSGIIGVTLIFCVWLAGQMLLVNPLQNTFTTTLSGRLNNLSFLSTNTTEESAAWRLVVWKAALTAVQRQPIFGLGLGQSLPYEFEGYETEVEIRELHNDFVSVAAQLGIVGFMALVVIQLSYLKNCWRLVKSKTGENLPVVIALTVVFIPLILGMNFGVYLTTNLTAIFFWLFLGLTFQAKELLK